MLLYIYTSHIHLFTCTFHIGATINIAMLKNQIQTQFFFYRLLITKLPYFSKFLIDSHTYHELICCANNNKHWNLWNFVSFPFQPYFVFQTSCTIAFSLVFSLSFWLHIEICMYFSLAPTYAHRIHQKRDTTELFQMICFSFRIMHAQLRSPHVWLNNENYLLNHFYTKWELNTMNKL